MKTTPNNDNVFEFINSVDNEKRRSDARVALDLFSQALDGVQPKMWGSSIIGYGTYHYRYASGREGDFMVTGFSPRKNNMTFYVISGFDEYAQANNYDPQQLLEKLGPYSSGKSCLYIKDLNEVNKQVLIELIELSVQQMKSIAEQPNSHITSITIQ